MQGSRFVRLLLCVLLLGVVEAGPSVTPAGAEMTQFHGNAGSNGWYPDQSTFSQVVVPNGTFGQLFKANVDGQVYAQPLVYGGKLLVVTENNKAYAFDKTATGTNVSPQWTANVGNAWRAADLGCPDLAPNIGITGTPVIDSATNTEYFVAKTYASGNAGPALQQLHALDVATGAERPGFPVTIAGAAQNAPGIVFDPTYHLQRPGLLLMDGVIYMAFGGMCDIPPYRGWIFGVSTGGQVVTRFITQPNGKMGGGIWQAGGALISDRPGDIVFTTGNGSLTMPAATGGSTPPTNLPESAVRVRVQPDHSLKPVDFFAPYDAPALDARDADFGSGGPVALPSSYNGTPLFGTAEHPNLMLAEGKAGYLFLLDRDKLGGYRMGPNGGDDALARLGPFGGVWGTPAVWPGDGGYVYMSHGAYVGTASFSAYKYGLDGQGRPTFAPVATAADGFGFGSGSPVVTSDGLTPGSALVWVIWQAAATGQNAQLRAYDAVPVNGRLNLRWSAPIGTATKFAPPAVSDNRVYVGTRDGTVLGFGSPIDQPFNVAPTTLNFGSSVLNTQKQLSLTLTANHDVDITARPTSSNAAFTIGTPTPSTFPLELEAGDTLTLPVTFKPTVKALTSGAITVPLDEEAPFLVATQGSGQAAGGDLVAFPDGLSLGGAKIGGPPVSQPITFTNAGASPLRITSRATPVASSAMTVSGLPNVGATLSPGQSVIATVSFAPPSTGLYTGTVALSSDAAAPGNAQVQVGISGAASSPAHLVIQSDATYFGAVRLGTTATRSVVLKNTGGTPLTVTKSKPPGLGVGFSVPPGLELDEGSTIGANSYAIISVSFKPATEQFARDTWVINADDDTGLHTLSFNAYGAQRRVGYWMADQVGRVYTIGNAGPAALAAPPPTGSNLVAITPTPTRAGYLTLDVRGKVQRAGDAQYLGSLPANVLRPYEIASSLAMTPSGRGYWIFTNLGRVFRFGDAPFLGDLAQLRLTRPIVSSIPTLTGLGYYMIGGDGGVFAFGDAKFYGSTGARRLNQPVVAIVPTGTGRGYWLAASDGGIFAFGDAAFRGSMGATKLRQPIVAMIAEGNGYLMIASDGGVFNFSNQPFVGSLGGRVLPAPITSVGSFTIG